MRVVLPQPPAASTSNAFGADYVCRRMIESFHAYARDIDFHMFDPRGGFPDSPARLNAGFGARAPVEHAPTATLPPAWDLLHDVRPTRDPRRLFYFRSSRNARFPIAMTHHALCYPEYLDGFFIPLLLAQTQPYDAVVCTSRASHAAFVKLLEICSESIAGTFGTQTVPRFSGQLPIIPLGVDTELFRPRDVNEVRQQLGLPRDTFVLLWIGRISAVTKADLLPLIRAYWLLRQRNPGHEMLLAIVGTDREGFGQALDAYAEELGLTLHLRVERTTPDTPIHHWYSAADVFVSPIDNLQESFGLAPVEAMSSGVAQVVSDWDGHRDTVVHGETGFMVRTYWGPSDDDAIAAWVRGGDGAASQALLAQAVACDIGDLVQRIEQLLLSPDLRLRMGAAARARAVAQFAWPVIVNRYVELWTSQNQRALRSEQPSPSPHWAIPAFFRAFSGYASHELNGSERIRIRDDALGVFRNDQPMPPSIATGIRLNRAGLHAIAEVVAAAGGVLSLDEIGVALVSRERTRHDVWRIVLAGLKHGFFEIDWRSDDVSP